MVKTYSLFDHIRTGFNAFFKDWKTYGVLTLFFMILPHALTHFMPTYHWSAYVIMGIVMILASTALQLSTTFIASRTLQKKKTKTKDLHKVLKEKFWKFLLTNLLVAGVLALVFLPFLLLMIGVGAALGETGLGVGLAIVVILLGLLAIAFVGTLFYFTSVIMVQEKKTFYRKALIKSATLLKKNFLRNFGYVLVFQIIATALAIVFSAIFSGLFYFAPEGWTLLIISLVQTFVTLPLVAVSVHWYQHYG